MHTEVYDTTRNIRIVSEPFLQSITNIFIEHYFRDEYANTLFLINVGLSLINYDGMDYSKYSRIVYYNLEHLEVGICYTTIFLDNILEYLKAIGGEWWDFCIENLDILKNHTSLNKEPQFVPVRFSSYNTNKRGNADKFIDCGFVGSFQRFYAIRRLEFLQLLSETAAQPDRNKSFSFMVGKSIGDMQSLDNCRWVLDTQSVKTDGSTQNQVRIFEYISLGYSVIVEDIDGINYFPGMVETLHLPKQELLKGGGMSVGDEYEFRVGIEELYNILDKEPHNYVEQYKAMTYTDEAYERYRQDMVAQYKALKKTP